MSYQEQDREEQRYPATIDGVKRYVTEHPGAAAKDAAVGYIVGRVIGWFI